jgi:hypothetical protein
VAEDSSNQLLTSLIEMYPPEFKMVHRVVVKTHGKEFDFSGYFLMRRPNSLHAAAYAEAGSAIFEFQNGPDGAEVQAKPEFFSEDSIINGVMQDLLHVYQKLPKSDGHLVGKGPTERVFSFGNPDSTVHDYKISKEHGLISSLNAVDGAIIREVTYAEPKTFNGWPHAFPTQLKIVNFQYGYELSVNVVEFTPDLPNNFDQMLLAP